MSGVASVPNIFAAATEVQTTQWDANWAALVAYANDPTNRISFSGDSGAANAYVLAPSPAVTYSGHFIVWFIPGNTNTTASTASANGGAPLPIFIDLNTGPIALAGGEIIKNNACGLMFDGTLNAGGGGWHLLNSARAKQPTRTVITTSGSSVYTTPTGSVRINVRLVGGGGGGSGSGGGGVGSGGNGGNTTFGAGLTGTGGSGGASGGGIGGSGGGASGGDINFTGGIGGSANASVAATSVTGGAGGNSAFGGGGGGGVSGSTSGSQGATNTGGGGGGAISAAGGVSGAGGGAGGYVEKLIVGPAATFNVNVGAFGTAGAGGAGGAGGSAGGTGIIIVDEYYY